jgi:hypothetical protein
MPSLVVFSPSGQLVTQEVREAELPQFVRGTYQPVLDRYIVGIADYVEKWTSESKNAVQKGIMNPDLWISLNQRLRPYSNTLNVIDDNAVKNPNQQSTISSLRSGIRTVNIQTMPEAQVSWWDRLFGTSADIASYVLGLDALNKVSTGVKNFYASEKQDIATKVADRAFDDAKIYLQTDAAKKILADAAASAGKGAADDPGVKKLVTVLTVGSAVVLGSLAVWLLVRSRK